MPVVEYTESMGNGLWETYVKPYIIPSPKKALTSLFDPTALLPGTGLKVPTPLSFVKTAVLDQLRSRSAPVQTIQQPVITPDQSARLREKKILAKQAVRARVAPSRTNLAQWSDMTVSRYNQAPPEQKPAVKQQVLQQAKTLDSNFLSRMDQNSAAEFVGTFLPEIGDQPTVQAASMAIKNGAEASARTMGFAILAVVGTGAVIWGISAAAKAAKKKKAA